MKRRAVALLVLTTVCLSSVAFGDAPGRTLRVCADPDNLPFSNQLGEGLENELAELVAAELGLRLEYTWWAQRRGFFKNTVKAGRCDLVLGVPAELEMVATSRPYYRSSYVFLQRARDARIESFDDPRLRRLRIGVPLVGDDGANPPPVMALTRRGVVDNVRGFVPFELRQGGEPRIVRALLSGEIDVAVVWGPLGGWAAKRHPELRLTKARPDPDADVALSFSIAAGVRRGNKGLLADVQRALDRRRADVARLLSRHGVPRL